MWHNVDFQLVKLCVMCGLKSPYADVCHILKGLAIHKVTGRWTITKAKRVINQWKAYIPELSRVVRRQCISSRGIQPCLSFLQPLLNGIVKWSLRCKCTDRTDSWRQWTQTDRCRCTQLFPAWHTDRRSGKGWSRRLCFELFRQWRNLDVIPLAISVFKEIM